MATFTLFDKPHYAGLSPNDQHAEGREGTTTTKPVAGVEWQVLTANGLRMSCTSFGALQKWQHPKVSLRAVSHNGERWRNYAQFRTQLDRGVRPEIAIEQTPWLDEIDK